MKVLAVIAILIIGTAMACKRPAAAVFPTDRSIPPDLEIRLARTQCYGRCPAYELTVRGDGSVTFKGTAHTQETEASGRIDENKVRRLIDEFRQANYFDFDDEYSVQYLSVRLDRHVDRDDLDQAQRKVQNDKPLSRLQHA